MGGIDEFKGKEAGRIEDLAENDRLPTPESAEPEKGTEIPQDPTATSQRIGDIDTKVNTEIEALNAARGRLGLEPTDTSVAIDALRSERRELVGTSGALVERTTAPRGERVLQGEILSSDDAGPEDPRITARFAELPEELGKTMSSIDRRSRRLYASDEHFINMPYEDLYRLSKVISGDNSLEDLREIYGMDSLLRGTSEPSVEPRVTKDVTPKPGPLEGPDVRKKLDYGGPK